MESLRPQAAVKGCHKIPGSAHSKPMNMGPHLPAMTDDQNEVRTWIAKVTRHRGPDLAPYADCLHLLARVECWLRRQSAQRQRRNDWPKWRGTFHHELLVITASTGSFRSFDKGLQSHPTMPISVMVYQSSVIPKCQTVSSGPPFHFLGY
jgi:hypothetical protein